MELSAYPVDPDFPDMPMDRGIIPAVTLLNSIGITTNHSCQGHEICDTVGVVGTFAPQISIDYSEKTFAYLLNCLADFTEKKRMISALI
jgi:hypothetical protein